MNIVIRQEQPDDMQSIHDVTVAAFLNAPHSDHNEQFIVRELRKASALLVSLVAEVNGKMVGHVAVSPVAISDNSENWYGLGPISVIPGYQRKGVGSKLMQAAIEALRTTGASGCVLLGNPNFYHRFGFSPIEGLILEGVPAEYFQALVFQGDIPQGEVVYHQAFSAKG